MQAVQHGSSCGDTSRRHLLPSILVFSPILVLLVPFWLRALAGVRAVGGRGLLWTTCSREASVNCQHPDLYPHFPARAFGGFPNNQSDFSSLRRGLTFPFSETTEQGRCAGYHSWPRWCSGVKTAGLLHAHCKLSHQPISFYFSL